MLEEIEFVLESLDCLEQKLVEMWASEILASTLRDVKSMKEKTYK